MDITFTRNNQLHVGPASGPCLILRKISDEHFDVLEVDTKYEDGDFQRKILRSSKKAISAERLYHVLDRWLNEE